MAPGEFLQQAAHQPVDWRPMGLAALAEARRAAKPVLLVIGAPWSETARNIDSGIFSNQGVAAQINDSFIPIRVDEVQQPRWLSAFMPLKRLGLPFVAGFQVFVLDSRGHVLSYIGPTQGSLDLDINMFLDALRTAKARFTQAELSDQLMDDARDQRTDIAALDQSSSGMLPNFEDFANGLTGPPAVAKGGFNQGGIPRILPNAWLFQLRVGRCSDMSSLLDQVLLSPAIDVVRGGVFTYKMSNGRPVIDYDQITTLNAELAALLAEASVANHDALYDRVAHETFDMLLRDLSNQGLFFACRESDQGPKARSASASFPDRRLNDILTSDEHAWARTRLGLSPFTNGQMIPSYQTRDVLTDPMLDQVVGKLRAAPHISPLNAGVGCLDVNGHTAACLMRCARLWGDQTRLDQLLDTVSAIDSFRQNSDVAHVLTSSSPGTYLGDYLAYSDALLEDYLCTGRVVSFVNGLAVLERSMSLFQGGEPGLYLTVHTPEDPLIPPDIQSPEVVDEVRESCTAQMIRLLLNYGRMLGPGEESRRLLVAASDTASRFSQIEVSPSPKLAGYLLATAEFADSQCAFAVGPHAQELADRLFRLRPARLVSAAFGPVRPDLRTCKPGIYVANGQVVAGPYTVDEAADLMPATLQVGVTPN
jgi:hypothetical protein